MLDVGRKRAIAWNSVFFIVGPLMMAGAGGPALLSAGRFVIGLGVGVSAVVGLGLGPAHSVPFSPQPGCLLAVYQSTRPRTRLGGL